MYDYVIVGAGSAGCVLANRLSADPALRVLLVEAGPPDSKREIAIPAGVPKLFRSEVDWAYWSEPEHGLDGRRIFVPRGKTLGGSSAINCQMYVRGHRAAYDAWEAAGNPGWGWEDVLPYFRRSERNVRGADVHHGGEGPQWVDDQRDPNPLSAAFVQAAVEAGIARNDDLNGESAEGAGLVQVTQSRGRRFSTADAYLRPARRRPNLEVMTGATVEAVRFEDHRASGVAYRISGERRFAAARREVLLCAGALNSPQLLMLSGIGPAEHLRAHGIDVVRDLPGVGQDLQDHLAAAVLAAVSEPVTLFAAERPVQLLRYLTRRRGLLTSNIGEAAAFVRTRPDAPAPDLELLCAPVLFREQGLARPERHGMTIASVALAPRSRGSVALRSADPAEPPVLRFGYLGDPDGEDLRVLISGLRLARRILAQPAMAAWIGDELDPGPQALDDEALEAHVRATAHTLYHPVGTASMGPVVDAELRVRGVERLRVVDASVMPVIPAGHTNAAAIMIGEKGADLVLGGDRAGRAARLLVGAT